MLLLLLSACIGDYAGSIKLELSGAETGTFTANSSEVEAGIAVWPAPGEQETGEPVFLTSVQEFLIGPQGSDFSEYDHAGGHYNSGGSATVEVVVERITWNDSSRFPFTHEGRLSGAIEALEVEGEFLLNERNCLNSVLSEGNLSCGGGYFNLGPERPQVMEVQGFERDDCPQEIRDEYIDGTTIEAWDDRLEWGTATAVDCVPVARDTTLTSGDESWEGGPYVCGADTTITVDGCDWEVVVFANPQGTFWVVGGVVDEACEPAQCAVTVASVAIEGATIQ